MVSVKISLHLKKVALNLLSTEKAEKKLSKKILLCFSHCAAMVLREFHRKIPMRIFSTRISFTAMNAPFFLTNSRFAKHTLVVAASYLLVLSMCSVRTSAQTGAFATNTKKIAGGKSAPQSAEYSSKAGSIWLSLDVVEHQYNASGSELGKEKYRSDVDLQVIDSASNRQLSVRSGETIQLQPKRTYYIMLSDIPQRYGMVTKLAGQQTQVLRTPKATANDDVMFERKFVLNSRPGTATARELGASQRIPSGLGTPAQRKLPPPEMDDEMESNSFPSAFSKTPAKAGIGASKMNNLNYYVIQYCSLKNQTDALEARSFLMRNGIRDARVEIFVDKFGESYYRLRSGSYNDLSLAKMTVEQTLWKNRKFLGLKQKPIIVRAGV